MNPKWIHDTCQVNVKILFTLKLCAWYHEGRQDVDVMHVCALRGPYLYVDANVTQLKINHLIL